jgi:hypothetical protein
MAVCYELETVNTKLEGRQRAYVLKIVSPPILIQSF